MDRLVVFICKRLVHPKEIKRVNGCAIGMGSRWRW